MLRVMWIAVIAVLAVAGCKKDEKAAAPSTTPVAGSGSATVAGSGSGSTQTPTPSVVAVPNTTRPASVTDAQVKTADALIAATEEFANAVAAAGSDCKKATAAIKANAPKIAPIVEEAQKLTAVVDADPAAKQWFQAMYMPKMMAAAKVMAPITEACREDPDFVAAATNVPMGPRGKPTGP